VNCARFLAPARSWGLVRAGPTGGTGNGRCTLGGSYRKIQGRVGTADSRPGPKEWRNALRGKGVCVPISYTCRPSREGCSWTQHRSRVYQCRRNIWRRIPGLSGCGYPADRPGRGSPGSGSVVLRRSVPSRVPRQRLAFQPAPAFHFRPYRESGNFALQRSEEGIFGRAAI